MKKCNDCGIEKDPVDGFYVNRKTADGRDRKCKVCVKMRAKIWASQNKQRVRENHERWRTKNYIHVRQKASLTYLENIDSVKKRAGIWRKQNPQRAYDSHREYRLQNKDKMAFYSKRYISNNLPLINIATAKRRANRLNATPLWADHAVIKMIYAACRELTEVTGILHHVDHIVPLKSKIVCGLHNEFNLQPIPARDNLIKGNRHWPDMP